MTNALPIASVISITPTDSPLDDLSRDALLGRCRYLEALADEQVARLKVAYNLLDTQVSENQRLMTALREGERRYLQIIESASEAVYIIDLYGILQYVNPASEKLTGYPAGELIGVSYEQLVPTGQSRPMRALYLRQWYNRTPQMSSEIPIRTQSGELKWIEQTVTLLIENERVTGFQGVARDVTARKQAEDASHESEERLRRLTDNMLDVIVQTNAKGIIEYASPSCWNVLGYAPEMLIGQDTDFWLNPSELPYLHEAMQNVDCVECQVRHVDGRYIWMEAIGNVLFDDNGAISGWVYAIRNITERKKAQDQLYLLDQMKTDFLSTAAHELRTPLTSIRGFSEVLLTRQLDETRQRRYLTLINNQSSQLGQIIDDLLDVSRLEAGRGMKITPEMIKLADLLDEVIVPFSESQPQHTFQVEALADLPPVRCDPFRMAQVCKNLISNAVKYSPKGGPITIRGRLLATCMEISVQDQGIGMTPEQQTHLFEKFYRANATNTAISGTGLGLAITKLIIELHGGKITVDSTPGVGTTVSFTLPLTTLALPVIHAPNAEPA